jgi:hypothetical protein
MWKYTSTSTISHKEKSSGVKSGDRSAHDFRFRKRVLRYLPFPPWKWGGKSMWQAWNMLGAVQNWMCVAWTSRENLPDPFHLFRTRKRPTGFLRMTYRTSQKYLGPQANRRSHRRTLVALHETLCLYSCSGLLLRTTTHNELCLHQ